MNITIDKKTGVLLAIIALLVAALASFAINRDEDREMGKGMRTNEMHHGSSASSDYTGADIMFLQMMIPHHQQAIDISNLAMKSSSDGELLALAKSITKSQSAEIIQLEKNFYSYQAGYLKHLYRMAGYNENFESYVSSGVTYDTYYIKFNEYDKSAYQWGDYIYEDATVIIAAPNADTSGIAAAIETVLEAALGSVSADNTCITTTSTTTTIWPTTSTTSTNIP